MKEDKPQDKPQEVTTRKINIRCVQNWKLNNPETRRETNNKELNTLKYIEASMIISKNWKYEKEIIELCLQKIKQTKYIKYTS